MNPAVVESLRLQIESCFPAHERPLGHDLIVHDGYDRLDKESAEATLLKFDAGELLRELTERDYRDGWQNALEDWQVLQPPGGRYYGQPFLLRALLELDSSDPDEEYLWFLLVRLGYFLKRWPGIFNDSQASCIRTLADAVFSECSSGRFSYCAEFIRDSIVELRGLLGAGDGVLAR